MIKSLGLLLVTAICSFAQAIYIGGGLTASPYSAGNVTLGICTRDGSTCQLTNFEGKGTLADLKARQLQYSVTTGVRQVVASVTAPKAKVDLFMVGQAGASITTGANGFNGAVGGGLTWHPIKAPNWAFTVAAHGNYSPSPEPTSKWQPWVGIQLGYTFRSVN